MGVRGGSVGVASDIARAGIPPSYNDIFKSYPLTVNGDYLPPLVAGAERGGFGRN